jgi:hypothetical protein
MFVATCTSTAAARTSDAATKSIAPAPAIPSAVPTNTGLIATSNVRGRAAAAHARSDPERTAGNVSA